MQDLVDGVGNPDSKSMPAGCAALAVIALVAVPLAVARAQPPADSRPWSQAEKVQQPATLEHGSRLAPRPVGNRIDGGDNAAWPVERGGPSHAGSRDLMTSEDRAALRTHIREQGQIVYKR